MKFYKFDRQSAKEAVAFLVHHAYLVVGDQVFRQIRGIPMGIGPAMYMANLYLFQYEHAFFKDAFTVMAAAQTRAQENCVALALKPFAYTSRFADDMAVMTYHTRHEVEGLFYTDQSRNGIHGIYPRSLNLKSSTVGVGRIMEFLDITAAPSHENGIVGPIRTSLYDKRRLPQFRQHALGMRFPAADSMLAWSCKLNVFTAQFMRMAGIITDEYRFQTEIATLLIEMITAGYPSGPLFHRLRFRCMVTPMLFGAARGTHTPSNPNRRPVGMYQNIRTIVTRTIPGLV